MDTIWRSEDPWSGNPCVWIPGDFAPACDWDPSCCGGLESTEWVQLELWEDNSEWEHWDEWYE